MSVTPRRFSRRATFALTVVLGMPSRRAAWLKLPASTTFTNSAMPSRSMARLSILLHGHSRQDRLIRRGREAYSGGHEQPTGKPKMISRAFYDAWTPRALAALRIVTAYLFLQHATAKLFH